MFSLQVCGEYDDPRIQQGMRYLEQRGMFDGQWKYYGMYYVSASLYQLGGTAWGKNYPKMREELIKERLSQWKADHANLLARFDRDGDGRIDLAEWEVARRAAKREVTREQLREASQPLHTLSSTGSRRRPFLISSQGEFNLVKRFRLFAFGALAGFFAVGAGAVWMFVSRFGGLLA